MGVSTSTGRVLDAIAAALHICGERSYEGECAMKFESVAYKSTKNLDMSFEIKKQEGRDVLKTSLILKEVMENIQSGESVPDIAQAAQRTLAEGMAALAIKSADQKRVWTLLVNRRSSLQ